MIRPVRKRKCKHCKELFLPDPRNVKRQKHCSKPLCQKASKAESQRRWLEKPENQDYFRGPDQVERVRIWRAAHPEYWRSKKSLNADALQDGLRENKKQNQLVEPQLTSSALQDPLNVQPTVIIGLIAHLTGSALQDDIATSLKRMQQLGNDILFNPNYAKGGQHASKTSYLSTAHP
jgi:hypothetical protein